MSGRPTRAEAFQKLAEYAALAELERFDAMSGEEVKAELAAQGLKPAKGDDLVAAPSGPKIVGRDGPPSSESVPDLAHAYDAGPASSIRRPGEGRVVRLVARLRARPRAELIAAAATILFLIVVGYRLYPFRQPDIARPNPQDPNHHDPNVPQPAPTGQPQDDGLKAAAELRQQAKEACDKAAWEKCWIKLDEAAKLDPAGNTSDEVRELRRKASAAATEEDRLEREKEKSLKRK